MRKTVIILFVLTTFSCSHLVECNQTISGFDLNNPYSETVDFDKCGDYIVYYASRVKGELSGEFLIKDIYQIKAAGKINTLIRGEHYSNKFNFKYSPIGSVKEDLEFQITLL